MYKPCMNTPNSIADLISRWPTVAAFASDIGCGYQAAIKMRDRGAINARHWTAVVDAAHKAGVNGVDLKWLAEIRAAK